MVSLDDLFAQIPIQDIANQLGADSGEVDSTIRTLVPVLVSGLSQNAQDPGQADSIVNTAATFAAQGLLDNAFGASQSQGQQVISTIFGGNDTNQVASALSGLKHAATTTCCRSCCRSSRRSCSPTSASS